MSDETSSSRAGQVYRTTPGSTDVEIDLREPRSRFFVRVEGGTAGRAEARFGEQRWAAKHYWREDEAGVELMAYEFDEPVPAGRFILHVPVTVPTV